jgi:glycosyltransferase involved in cell wall biosynthesis
MKIVLATHHFLPRYTAGAELYAYRTARWLHDNGHDVAVVCVESITDRGPRTDDGDHRSSIVSHGSLGVARQDYDGLAVYRLYFNLAETPNPFRWSYWNPDIGSWFEGFLREQGPDVLHLNSGYLLSGTTIPAAQAAHVPFVLVLHDYWFLCPRLTLQRPSGDLTALPNPASDCAWCLMTQSRRYRLPDVASGGMVGRLARALLGRSGSARVGAIEERRRVLGEVLRQVPAFVAPSRFMRDAFIGHGLPPDRFHLIRYGLDTQLWQRAAAANGASARHVNGAAAGLHIAYLGQVIPHKGVHLLVEAFQKLSRAGVAQRDARLTIYGNLDNQPYVQRLRQQSDDEARISFAGPYDNRRVAELLGAVDVCVVPSIWYENSPTVILEAQLSGTPVVTANLGGMAELVRHDVDGLLFRPGDADDLARQLQRLLDEPELLPRLSANAPPVLTMDEHMRQLMQVYRAVITGCPLPTAY